MDLLGEHCRVAIYHKLDKKNVYEVLVSLSDVLLRDWVIYYIVKAKVVPRSSVLDRLPIDTIHVLLSNSISLNIVGPPDTITPFPPLQDLMKALWEKRPFADFTINFHQIQTNQKVLDEQFLSKHTKETIQLQVHSFILQKWAIWERKALGKNDICEHFSSLPSSAFIEILKYIYLEEVPDESDAQSKLINGWILSMAEDYQLEVPYVSMLQRVESEFWYPIFKSYKILLDLNSTDPLENLLQKANLDGYSNKLKEFGVFNIPDFYYLLENKKMGVTYIEHCKIEGALNKLVVLRYHHTIYPSQEEVNHKGKICFFPEDYQTTMSIHKAVSLGTTGKWSKDIQNKAKEHVIKHLNKTCYFQDYDFTKDEACAIIYWTLEARFHLSIDSSFSIHKLLNECIITRNEEQIEPWKPYLYWLTQGLQKVIERSPFEGRVYRGIKAKVSSHYKVGNRIVWITPTSTSKVIKEMKKFTSKTDSTMFFISVLRGADISKLSLFPNEQEILLLPNTIVKVEDVLTAKMREVVSQLSTDSSFIHPDCDLVIVKEELTKQ
eukprot:TRINITY_DN805_c0_g1_i1.p1 TRINITY_DN805_c0_g1~~TRINITY_DN805_c0_g1_i1.p1  ORF type:complete len:550 (-),score=121.91 TRINITY_DN805_c0_g1_i1:17-1666(-)